MARFRHEESTPSGAEQSIVHEILNAFAPVNGQVAFFQGVTRSLLK